MENEFNTKLEPLEEMFFQKWLKEKSSLEQRDVGMDLQEYDWRGWFKENSGELKKGGHVTDKYKKPSHPTFSDESQYHGVAGAKGGSWGNDAEGAYFKPAESNMDNEKLKEYFKRTNENVRIY